MPRAPRTAPPKRKKTTAVAYSFSGGMEFDPTRYLGMNARVLGTGKFTEAVPAGTQIIACQYRDGQVVIWRVDELEGPFL